MSRLHRFLLGVVLIAGVAPEVDAAATNWALASNGGSATASSQYDTGSYAANKAIDGSRVGTGNVNYWNDGTGNSLPDWLRVTFSSAKSINEINVITLQDNLSTPSEPTEAMTFSAPNNNQPTAFEVQYWDGSAWQTISGGSVTGNNKVWRKFTLSTPIKTTSVRVNVTAANGAYTAITELEAWGDDSEPPEPPSTPVNVALAANGGTASASSQYSATYGAAKAIDGDRTTDGYNDANPDVYPDWLRVDFSGAKTIEEINVFTLQDSKPSDPTEDMTFTLWGIIDFEVQYWDGSAFVTIPGGSVTGNNKVWRKFTFAPLTTSAIRVNVTKSKSYTRIVELEAMEAPAPGPGNLTASAVSGTQIDLAWIDTTATETGFQVERKTGAGGTYALVASPSANATSYQDTGLSIQTSYYYRVRAMTPGRPTLYSNEANATTLGAVPAPGDLTAAAASPTQVNLTWTDNSGNETGFQIERKLGPTGSYGQVGTVGVNVTSYSDTSASGVNLYYYRVLATSATGNSNYSNEASAITPADSPFSNVYYIHNDHLNTPRAISDSTNTIVWRWESDPFGSTVPDQDPDGNSVAFEYNLRFPGQYFDKETGLHYNYFRDYDPAIGRYIQSDPIGLAGGINSYAYVDSVGKLVSPSVNTYSYAHSNPLSVIDPLGLWSIEFGAYTGVGGTIIFGSDPTTGGGFLTGRLGFGVGGGIKWQKSGGRPGADPCDRGGWGGGTFVDWFEGNLGPLFAGLGSNRGINFKNDGSASRYNTPLNPNWGFGGSWGIKAAISGGSEWTIFNSAGNQCGCQ